MSRLTRPWETLSQRLVLDGGRWLRVWEEVVRLPSGRTLTPFYRYQKGDFCSIVAVTSEGRIVVERRYRHGPRVVTLDIPAGYIEEGEEPLVAAKRELMEETGHEASEWRALGRCATDGNGGGSVCHLFLALGARQVAAPQEDDTEEAELLHLTPSELRAALEKGGFATLAAIAAASRALLELERSR